jgi:hypothetical protein
MYQGGNWGIEYDAWRSAYDLYRDYRGYWPKIPRKTFRRLIKRSYIAALGQTYGITEAGEAALAAQRSHAEWWQDARSRYGPTGPVLSRGRSLKKKPRLSDIKGKRKPTRREESTYLKGHDEQAIDMYLTRRRMTSREDRSFARTLFRMLYGPPEKDRVRIQQYRRGWGERLRRHALARKDRDPEPFHEWWDWTWGAEKFDEDDIVWDDDDHEWGEWNTHQKRDA